MNRRADAIHEAGHAVAFCRLFRGISFGDVTIVPDFVGNAAGSFEFREELCFPWTEDAEERKRQDAEFRKKAIVWCAGYAAVVAAGHPDTTALAGCWDDFEKAKAIVGANLAAVKVDAVEFMQRPENVAAVARVAYELERRGTVQCDDVDRLLDVADGVTTEQEYERYLASR